MILTLSQSKRLNCKSLFVATGVVAFVNDCIKERWNEKKVKGLPLMSCLAGREC